MKQMQPTRRHMKQSHYQAERFSEVLSNSQRTWINISSAFAISVDFPSDIHSCKLWLFCRATYEESMPSTVSNTPSTSQIFHSNVSFPVQINSFHRWGGRNSRQCSSVQLHRMLETTVGHWFLSHVWIFQLSFAWWWIQVFRPSKEETKSIFVQLARSMT